VAGLATAVPGFHEGFESPSVVDVHWDARGKCTQRGVAGVAAVGGCERRSEKGMRGGAG
jgi:hypothetical protein